MQERSKKAKKSSESFQSLSDNNSNSETEKIRGLAKGKLSMKELEKLYTLKGPVIKKQVKRSK